MTAQKIGRYEVKSELGRGGMATVFLATDPLIGRDIAVKVLPREFLHDPSFRGRFEREARTIAMLEHPAIVPIYDFGEQDGQPYLVMRYMQSGTLGDRIKDGPLPIAEAAEILKRIGSALDHAHSRGVIHRDLKPGNILFDEAGRAFLSDFGIVKLAQSNATFTGGGIIGTPAYMSPEQVHGDKDIDGRSDIYTLGVILFEMLTGQMPYRADTPAKLMMAHVLNPVPRIIDVRPDLPSATNNILGKALAKSPDERFTTAGDLSTALEDTLEGKSPIQPTILNVPEPAAGDGTAVADPTAAPSTQDRRPSVPASRAQSRPAIAPPVAAKQAASKSGASRVLIGVVALLGVLALCCGGFFLYSYLFGDEPPVVDASGTATAGALILVEDGTPQSESTPDTSATPDQAATGAVSTGVAQAATATVQAQEDAIATRVAESTMTAEARAAATAAYAPTRIVEQAIQMVLNAQQNDPLFGPESSSLVHVPDGFVKAYYSGVSVRDFVVDAVFFNPYAASRGDWDIGYSLREGEVNDQFRLAVESNGDWSLSDRRGDDTNYVNSGTLTNLNTGEGEGNRLTVYMSGDVGYFFVNGQFVSELDLSARDTPGDIGVATSLFAGYEIEGEETAFEEFTVWPIE